MLNILFFFYFSYLAARLFAKRAFCKDCIYLSVLVGYIGLMDLVNTNGTIYSSGLLIIAISFIIKAVLIYCSYATLRKCRVVENRMRQDAKHFKRNTVSEYRYRKVS